MKKNLKKLIEHLEYSMDVIMDEYGISQSEIDNKGKYCMLNRGNDIYTELGNMQRTIELSKKALLRA